MSVPGMPSMWSKIPNRELPEEPVPFLIPDLAIEVLSLSNTRAEMARKRRDYFGAGVRLVRGSLAGVRAVAGLQPRDGVGGHLITSFG